jgi:hypothetical protein
MNKDLKSKIINEIEQSGFPLELHVTEILREQNYVVFPNLTFRHTDQGMHEIDALAFLLSDEIEKKPWIGTVGINLIIECKKSKEKPWVFFEEVWDPSIGLGLGSQICAKSELKYQKGYDVLAGCMNTALRAHHYNSTLPVARTYFEAFKRDGKAEIFQGVSQVWYALAFWKRWFESSGVEDESRKARSLMCLPIIVFDGQLILARKRGKTFDAVEVNHLFLRTTDCLTTVQEPNLTTANEVIIDIVRFDYFQKYLQICQRNHKAFNKHLSQTDKTGWLERAAHART